MMELSKKYVFHIPLYKFMDDKLVLIEIGDVLDNLIKQFCENGFDGLYMTKVKSYYKSRSYDELLLTLFTNESPEEIFISWFRENNDVLLQEAFAYELDGRMYICEF